jgi:segregation and condensation protein A
VRFETLFSDAASRVEVIVTFLAMLELMKLNHLQVEQEQMLGEIVVVRPAINEAAKPLDFGG